MESTVESSDLNVDTTAGDADSFEVTVPEFASFTLRVSHSNVNGMSYG